MGAVLVTGGAGYIGSQNVKYLLGRGHDVMVLDNLVGGFRGAVPDGLLIEGSIGDVDLLNKVFSDHRIDAVINFASFIEVGASVKDPSSYFRNNLGDTLILLDAMVRHGVQKFVFSSTAAIFGHPEYSPIDEDHPKAPINPYGRSKWLVEQVLGDYASAYGLESVSLRYFNAAGADPDGDLGERHEPETHLIPLVLQAASGRRDSIRIFGDDYDTEDGTCVRDYIHVHDLAQAHWLALEYLERTGSSGAFNLGNGNGYSVRQVVEMARAVTGRPLSVAQAERRPGDPAVLVADSRLAHRILGWRPAYSDLATIVEHAWRWEQLHGLRW